MVKRVTREYVLCVFGGWFGLHKFYNKDFKKGFLYLFTLGIFGIGWIRDFITLYKGLPLRELTEAEIKYMEKRKEREELKVAKKQAEKDRIKDMKEQGIPYCPKCKSASVQYVERRKQFSLGRGIVGSAIAGGVGGAVGSMTSNKRKGFVKCLNCGNEWKK